MMGRKVRIYSSALITLSALLIIGIQSSCKHKGLNYSELDTVCYVRDVFPIFQNSCAITGCHKPPSGEGSYIFTNYHSIIKGITPFDPNKSIVFKAIIGNGASLMPPGLVLPENERILIRVWIGQGADSTTCPVAIVKPEVPSINLKFKGSYETEWISLLASSPSLSFINNQITYKQRVSLISK